MLKLVQNLKKKYSIGKELMQGTPKSVKYPERDSKALNSHAKHTHDKLVRIDFPALKQVDNIHYLMVTDLTIYNMPGYGDLTVHGGEFITDITTCPDFLKPILSDISSGNIPYRFATAAIVHDAFLHREVQITSTKLSEADIQNIRENPYLIDKAYQQTLLYLRVNWVVSNVLFLAVRTWSSLPKKLRDKLHSKF